MSCFLASVEGDMEGETIQGTAGKRCLRSVDGLKDLMKDEQGAQRVDLRTKSVMA